MKKLTDTVTLRHGATIHNRIVQPPMLTLSGSIDGFATADTIQYYAARSQSAGMVITEYHYVSKSGGPCSAPGYPEQLAIYDDAHIDSIKSIATAIKQHGNKAILQIHHGGREARGRAFQGKPVLAPSAIDYSFLPYKVREMTQNEIEAIIQDFGEATKRAIEAGFDGVEIHGANHYLLQQFFSTISNHRTDYWGGSLENRMHFPLAVVQEVKRVIDRFAPEHFIMGYRISPEEIHGAHVGYNYKEAQQLVREIVNYELDYIHLSLWDGYNDAPADCSQSYAELFNAVLDDQTKLIIVNNVLSEEAAQDAIQNYADLIAVGRGTLIDPEFGQKIDLGKGSCIVHEISPQQLQNSHLTSGLLEAFSRVDSLGLPPLPGGSSIRSYHTGKFDLPKS